MSFEDALEVGRIGEGLIAAWWQAQGWHVLPAYETEANSGKGPRLYMATQERLITPDMMCIKGARAVELDALRLEVLRSLARQAIEGEITDPDAWQEQKAQEAEDREALAARLG